MSDTNPTSVFLIEPTRETFEADVIERSRSVPVVIDFWAPWCGPCLRLGPLLEKLAQDYEGKFVLAKINTEREPQLAAQFGVRSIPAVFGVRDGKAVDGFLGRAAGGDDHERGSTGSCPRRPSRSPPTPGSWKRPTRRRPRPGTIPHFHSTRTCPPRISGWRGSRSSEGRLEDAQARIVSLERRGYLEPEAEKLKAELTLRMQAQQAGVVSLEAGTGGPGVQSG